MYQYLPIEQAKPSDLVECIGDYPHALNCLLFISNMPLNHCLGNTNDLHTYHDHLVKI